MHGGDPAYPWDVTFTIGNNDPIGFMLTSPEGESKQIVFIESEGPNDERIKTDAITSTQDFETRIDTPFSMFDFSGGLGQLEWDFNDDTSYWWGSGVSTHIPGRVYMTQGAGSQTLTGATTIPSGMITHIASNGTRWDFAWQGTKVWIRDASSQSGTWVNCFTAGVTITNIAIINGVALIAFPSLTGTTDFAYTTNPVNTSWTVTLVNHTAFSDATGKPKFFGAVRGTCYALVDPNKVFYTTDPTVDGWTGPIDTNLENNFSGPAGDETYNFTGFNAVGDFLFVRKFDAIYSIDSQQDIIEAIWQWKDKPSPNNFKYATTGSDQLIFNVGPECYTYDPTTGMTHSMNLAKHSGFSVKEILGVAANNQYIYVAAKVRVSMIRSADSVVIFRIFRSRPGFFSVECIWEDTDLTGDTYGALYAIPSGTDTRIYFSKLNDSTVTSYMIDLPAEWDESNESSYPATAELYTSISRSGFPGFIKRHLYFNMTGQNLDEDNTITVEYSTDNGETFTELDEAISDDEEFDYDDVNSKSIILKFTFTSDGTKTPILTSFDHHQRVRFKYLPVAQISVRIGRGIEARNSMPSNLTIKEYWDNIVELRTTDEKVIYKDFLGNNFPVTVSMIGVNPTRHEGPVDYEQEATLIIIRADRGE